MLWTSCLKGLICFLLAAALLRCYSARNSPVGENKPQAVLVRLIPLSALACPPPPTQCRCQRHFSVDKCKSLPNTNTLAVTCVAVSRSARPTEAPALHNDAASVEQWDDSCVRTDLTGVTSRKESYFVNTVWYKTVTVKQMASQCHVTTLILYSARISLLHSELIGDRAGRAATQRLLAPDFSLVVGCSSWFLLLWEAKLDKS